VFAKGRGGGKRGEYDRCWESGCGVVIVYDDVRSESKQQSREKEDRG